MCMCALEALLIVLTHKWCASNIDCVSGDGSDLFPTYHVHVQCYIDSGHVHVHRGAFTQIYWTNNTTYTLQVLSLRG